MRDGSATRTPAVREEEAIAPDAPSVVRLVGLPHLRREEPLGVRLGEEVRALPLPPGSSASPGSLRRRARRLTISYGGWISRETRLGQYNGAPSWKKPTSLQLIKAMSEHDQRMSARPTYTIHVHERYALSIVMSDQNSCVGSYVPRQSLHKARQPLSTPQCGLTHLTFPVPHTDVLP